MTTSTSSQQGAGQAPAVLGELREITEPAIQQALSGLHPGLARVESYHRGWTTMDGRPNPRPTGKALRSALGMLSARAADGPDAYGIAAAVCVELIHDFSLLHDDLMDGDTERRHQPTAWITYGSGAAILAGDALLNLASQQLLDSGSPCTLEALRLMNRCVSELIRGQALDLEFERRRQVPLEECKSMAEDKTAALLECASALGAVLSGAPEAQVNALGRYGRKLGLAFQLVDDVLGIWGDSESTGKPVLSDLRSRKKTLPITAALESGVPGLESLRQVLFGSDADPLDEAELEAAARELEDTGFRKWTLDEANRCLDAALDCVKQSGAPEAVQEDLAALAYFTVSRWF